MEALEHGYREFTDLLPEEELHELALKYGQPSSDNDLWINGMKLSDFGPLP